MLEAHNVGIKKGGKWLVRNVSLTLNPGCLTAIVGPNGAGKSTLLSALAGHEPVDEGEISLHGQPLTHWDMKSLARARAVMWQSATSPPGLKVYELVQMGRAPHDDTAHPTGRSALHDSMARTELMGFADRTCATLSGGERQRAEFARTLCQIHGTAEPLLLIDEPTASLDLKQEYQLLRAVRDFVDAGGACLAILHDLTLVQRFADQLIALKNGEPFLEGPADRTLSPAAIADLFDLPPAWLDTHGAIHTPHQSAPTV